MTIETETSPAGVFLVKLAGRMDALGTQEIDQAFMDQACVQRAVVVDLSGVDYMASVGIRTLLVVTKAVSKRAGKIVLLNPNPNVATVLAISGVEIFLPIHRSLDEASRAVSV